MKDLNVRIETRKLLEENIRGKFVGIGLDDDFFGGGFDTKSQGKQRKNKKVGLSQTKKLYTAKETINKIKR